MLRFTGLRLGPLLLALQDVLELGLLPLLVELGPHFGEELRALELILTPLELLSVHGLVLTKQKLELRSQLMRAGWSSHFRVFFEFQDRSRNHVERVVLVEPVGESVVVFPALLFEVEDLLIRRVLAAHFVRVLIGGLDGLVQVALCARQPLDEILEGCPAFPPLVAADLFQISDAPFKSGQLAIID